MISVFDRLTAEFNGHIAFRERRPGIVQVLAPLFHEDGDMVDMFIAMPKDAGGIIRISDHGMTLMRLSYSFNVDTPTKQKILDRIINENGIQQQRGRLYLDTMPEALYPSLLQFAQAIAKISNMQILKSEIVKSLFYEMLGEFINSKLNPYRPFREYHPVPDRDDLDVDWKFDTHPKHIFLFGVNNTSKARLATLACLEFQRKLVPFRSVIVHENFEDELSKKDQTRITNVVDKQFTSLQEFQSTGEEYFKREAISVQ